MSMTVNLIAEMKKNGEPVIENVLVDELGSNRFRLVRSPGLVPGLAAGDEFELTSEELHGYRLLKRGGNVCVQLFMPHSTDELRSTLIPMAEQFGGHLDGEFVGTKNSMIVFTFPITTGFPAIESVIARAKAMSPSCEWYYGNVYDLRDGVTPLNWWR